VHALKVQANGVIALSDYQVSVGRAHAGATITLLRNGDHITAYDLTGQPLGHLMINPGRRYQGALTPAA
jgi:hypothetical protein